MTLNRWLPRSLHLYWTDSSDVIAKDIVKNKGCGSMRWAKRSFWKINDPCYFAIVNSAMAQYLEKEEEEDGRSVLATATINVLDEKEVETVVVVEESGLQEVDFPPNDPGVT